MGTRGLVGIKVNGKYSGYYNHYDSYPEGLGHGMVEFVQILDASNIETMRHNCANLIKVESNSDPTQEDIDRYRQFSNSKVSTGTDWYSLLRNIQGADCLYAILRNKLEHVFDDIWFIGYSLFCEYAYILNLDELTLDFYRGFQHEPQEFNPFGDAYEESVSGSKYYPCAKILSIPFGVIKQYEVKQIVEIMILAISVLEKEEDEEDVS